MTRRIRSVLAARRRRLEDEAILAVAVGIWRHGATPADIADYIEREVAS